MDLGASGHERYHAAILRCPPYACAQVAQAHQSGPTQQHLDWAGLKRNMQKAPAQAALGSAIVLCNDVLQASSCCSHPSCFAREVQEAAKGSLKQPHTCMPLVQKSQ